MVSKIKRKLKKAGKTLIPTDFRDFLSIISFVGFLALVLKYAFDKPFLSMQMDSIFLIIGGAGLMVLGKVFTIGKWTRDGIQRNEPTQLLALTVGIAMMILGILIFADVPISDKFLGFIGIISSFPAIFIFADYVVKNK